MRASDEQHTHCPQVPRARHLLTMRVLQGGSSSSSSSSNNNNTSSSSSRISNIRTSSTNNNRKESFFAPSKDAIHPQLSLRTQKPYTVAVWQSCSEMQHRCA